MLTSSSKLRLLSRISAIEKALEEAIKMERAMAKRIMGLEHKARYEKKWLSMTETSEYTGYKKSTLYQIRRTGEITYRKCGGGLQFNRESIDEYLKAREYKSKSELVEQYNQKLKRA